ncbi:MAG TPA: FTR1 family protein, partial [Candidatus Hodarchaeales archaeon]|nr:FTR1 family protein [Candidatus Hodarchaeales archaeon]
GDLEVRIDTAISRGQRMAIISLVFLGVAREGAELVLFLGAPFSSSALQSDALIAFAVVFLGFLLGFAISGAMAIVLFRSTIRLNLRSFFNVTGLLLIVFAAGLVAGGFHELVEYLEISAPDLLVNPAFTELYNVNNSILGDALKFLLGWGYNPDYPGRFERSIFGMILSGLLGWNDNPALIEVVGYLSYFAIVGTLVLRMRPARPTQSSNAISP